MALSLGMIGVLLLGYRIKEKPIFSENREDYSFGRKDLYHIGLLLLLTLFSIRKLLTLEPIVYWDWFGFGLDALDAFPLSRNLKVAATSLDAFPLSRRW